MTARYKPITLIIFSLVAHSQATHITGAKKLSNQQLSEQAVLLQDSVNASVDPSSIYLVADVPGTAKADESFWNSTCNVIPSNAEYITVTIGEFVDKFRPVANETFCSMLQSNEKHQWYDPNKAEWVTPMYFGVNLGGSVYQWPKNNVDGDNRGFLSFWGTNDVSLTGGCCYTSIDNDSLSWSRAFQVHYIVSTGPNLEEPTAGASGDPHFRGFDGSQYDFQGSPGAVYNLITDENFQVNARFVESPTDGKTYMGAVGLRAGSNRILVTPDVVIVNDVSISKGNHVFLHQRKESSHDGVLMFDPTEVRVKTEAFQVNILIAEQEGFLYLDVDAVAGLHHLRQPHGILGQTAQFMVNGSEPHPVHLSHKNVNAQGFLAGTPEDYVVADGILGSQFSFNRFGKKASSTKSLAGRQYAFARALYQKRD